MRVGLSLMKIALAPLGLTAAVLAINIAILKKIYVSRMITLIISNEEIKDIMKIVKSLEVSDLLVNAVTEAIENEAKEQKRYAF